MKRTLFIFSLGLCAMAFAQSKINNLGLIKLNEFEQAKASRSSIVEDSVIQAVVLVNERWKTSDLEKYGAVVTMHVDDEILLIELPIGNVVAFSESDGVEFIDFGTEYKPMLDFGRPASDVTAVQSGFEYNNTNLSYTGKDVVVGLMDTGIDPNHVNFFDKNGTSRVMQAYNFTSNIKATTPDAVAKFTTDNTKETHGTHVAGILAGSYDGQGTYTTTTSPSSALNASIKSGNIPFYGVATESEIVMAGGSLTSTNIIAGVTYAVDYAESVGKPAVVNLSLGSNSGPHDGSSMLERSLSSLGQRGVICVSSGNEGDGNMFVGKSFTSSSNTLKTFIAGNKSSGVDIWGNDNTPFTVTVSLYDMNKGTYTDVASISAPGTVGSNSAFGSYMNGSFSMTASVNALNKRYNVTIGGSFTPRVTGQNVALIIEGKEGQRVWVYGYGDYATSFASNSVSGFVGGVNDGTLNNMACGENVIAVGAYTTRVVWGTFAGVYGYQSGSGFTVGESSPFSSFGENFSGVRLPVICAPGANIVSSLSRYYTKNISNPNSSSELAARVEGSSMNSYWGAMQGTSMACPYAAGVVALWLQADPSLTVNDIIEIMKETVSYKPTTGGLGGLGGGKLKDTDLRWGGGRLDALAGIKEVIRRKDLGGVDNVLVDGTGYVITPAGDRAYNIVVDGASALTATIYNMQGVAVATATAAGNEITIDAANAGSGAYILTVTAPNIAPISKKITL